MSLGVSTDEIIPSEGIGGYVKINFTVSSESTNISTPGTGSGASTQDFQNGVTDIMGNISDTLVEIVAAISDQLKALWDQMYNFMHLVLCQEKVQIKSNQFSLCLAKLNLLFLSHYLLDFSDILPHIGLGINTRNGCEYVLYCKMFLCIQKSTYMHVYN